MKINVTSLYHQSECVFSTEVKCLRPGIRIRKTMKLYRERTIKNIAKPYKKEGLYVSITKK